MDYIIDGYNLIFQCGLQTRSATDDMLRKARQRMIHEILAGVSKAVAKRITIVFDAAERPLLAKGNTETIGGMKIFYADQYDDADSMIEHLIAKHSVPRKLTVVSSDHRLHKAALRRKAIPIDSDLWFDQLEARKLNDRRATARKFWRRSIGRRNLVQMMSILPKFKHSWNPKAPRPLRNRTKSALKRGVSPNLRSRHLSTRFRPVMAKICWKIDRGRSRFGEFPTMQ